MRSLDSPYLQTAALLSELIAHLRENRTELRERWTRRIIGARPLTVVEAIEAGTFESLRACAHNLPARESGMWSAPWRLMDDFEIDSRAWRGTVVRVTKWTQ